ncbi:hypothetical protein ACJZ2D_013712 [Fusarium nematophilum]
MFIKVTSRMPAEGERPETLAQVVQHLKERGVEIVTIWGSVLWCKFGRIPVAWAVCEAGNGELIQESLPKACLWPIPRIGSPMGIMILATHQNGSLSIRFAARLLGKSTTSWTNFGIWQLKAVPEEQPPTPGPLLDALLDAALRD